MPYVGDGAPLHDAYVQPLPLSELWWRLLKPYRLPECPTHIVLTRDSGGVNATAGAERLGVYEKTEQLINYRPVYKKKGGDYLYYSAAAADHNNWLIGPEVGGMHRAIQSNSQDAAYCPNMASNWMIAAAGGAWQSSDVSAEVKYCGYEVLCIYVIDTDADILTLT